VANADGSVDLYFAPDPPTGHDANWVPTLLDHCFEILFRLYGPTPALFDKTWRLPDLEIRPTIDLTLSPHTRSSAIERLAVERLAVERLAAADVGQSVASSALHVELGLASISRCSPRSDLQSDAGTSGAGFGDDGLCFFGRGV
jgi:hypothetical protein